MAEVNWTVIWYLVIGLFALSGYFKGWWKEAIMTVFLAVLVLLLQFPNVALILIEFINFILLTISELVPIVNELLQGLVGTQSGLISDAPLQIAPGSSQTWLIILVLFISLAILVGRFMLPSSGRGVFPYSRYIVSRGAGWLGGLLGALNGWLIISLVRAYLNEGNLPGNNAAVNVSEQVRIQAVNMPTGTILDSFQPFLFVGIGLILFIAALRTRFELSYNNGYRKLGYKAPPGYNKFDITSK